MCSKLYYYFLQQMQQHTHINTLAFKRMRLLKLESYLKMRAVFCRGEFMKTVYIQKKQTRFKTQNTSIMMMLKSSKYLHTKETIRFDLVQPTHTHKHTLSHNVKRYLHFKWCDLSEIHVMYWFFGLWQLYTKKYKSITNLRSVKWKQKVQTYYCLV